MKKIILSIFLFSFSTLFAQTAKKEILLDEDNTIMAANDFKKKVASPERNYTYVRFENDTAVFGKIVLRKEYGVLPQNERAKLIEHLKELTDRSIDKNQTIIINFFFRNLTGNTTLSVNHYPSDSSYKRYIKNNPQIAQFFFREKGLEHKKEYVYEDKEEIIRNMFFPYNFEANYIIIKPNGHYFKHVGEYRQDDIPKIVEAEWKIQN